MEFTAGQLKDFHAYRKVQLSGRYNMFDPRARSLTGLERDGYLFVMKNYEELAKAAGVKL